MRDYNIMLVALKYTTPEPTLLCGHKTSTSGPGHEDCRIRSHTFLTRIQQLVESIKNTLSHAFLGITYRRVNEVFTVLALMSNYWDTLNSIVTLTHSLMHSLSHALTHSCNHAPTWWHKWLCLLQEEVATKSYKYKKASIGIVWISFALQVSLIV